MFILPVGLGRTNVCSHMLLAVQGWATVARCQLQKLQLCLQACTDAARPWCQRICCKQMEVGGPVSCLRTTGFGNPGSCTAKVVMRTLCDILACNKGRLPAMQGYQVTTS